MKNGRLMALAAAALAALAGMGCVTAPKQTAAERRGLAEAAVARWPEPSRLLALRIMEEHGLPERIELDRLLWAGRGEWRDTVVWREAPRGHGCLAEDVLEQSTDYRVPAERAPDLAWLEGRVRILHDGRVLSSCAPDEELNRLALNLADELLWGGREPGTARLLYERVRGLRTAGKSSAYLERLLFAPGPGR